MTEHVFGLNKNNLGQLMTWQPPSTTHIKDIQRVTILLRPDRAVAGDPSTLSAQQKIQEIQSFLFRYVIMSQKPGELGFSMRLQNIIEYRFDSISHLQLLTHVLRLTSLRHLRFHWQRREHWSTYTYHLMIDDFGRWAPPHPPRNVEETFFYDVKRDMLAGCPKLETLVISAGGPSEDITHGHPNRVNGWTRGANGRVNLFWDFQ